MIEFIQTAAGVRVFSPKTLLCRALPRSTLEAVDRRGPPTHEKPYLGGTINAAPQLSFATRLGWSVRAAGPEPFLRKTGVTGPRGVLVPPPSIASPHHQHACVTACASSTDAWVLLRQRCFDRRRCDTPHPPAVERHVCHRVGAYQPNRSEDDHLTFRY